MLWTVAAACRSRWRDTLKGNSALCLSSLFPGCGWLNSLFSPLCRQCVREGRIGAELLWLPPAVTDAKASAAVCDGCQGQGSRGVQLLQHPQQLYQLVQHWAGETILLLLGRPAFCTLDAALLYVSMSLLAWYFLNSIWNSYLTTWHFTVRSVSTGSNLASSNHGLRRAGSRWKLWATGVPRGPGFFAGLHRDCHRAAGAGPHPVSAALLHHVWTSRRRVRSQLHRTHWHTLWSHQLQKNDYFFLTVTRGTQKQTSK